MKDRDGTPIKKARRDDNIHFRVSAADKKEIEARAAKANKSVAEYVIELALNGASVDYTYLRKLLYEVSKIGTNINQAVRIMNTYYSEGDAEFDYVLREHEKLRDFIYSLPAKKRERD